MLNSSEYYERLRASFFALGDPTRAELQAAYMKGHFDFFGIMAPEWQRFLKDFFRKEGLLDGDELKDFIEVCFDDDCREMQYAAIEMVQKNIKKQDDDFINTLEYMILTKSWWDSVDWIAKLVGMHLQRYPEQILPITSRWITSDNIWLQRVSIIFQLHYKEKTDLELLFKYILMVSDSKEFFIQKACGWALRDLTKRFPDIIVDFVGKHPELSNLTKREALRLIISK